ncbi:MAG: GDSL-type esterase/lipase family protein [Steroidobacteraceae bacterium]
MADDQDGARGLSLGDSVVFGFITQAGHAYVNPTNFIGYPQYDSFLLNLGIANAACPGETSGSLLSATATDNGCRAFRSAFPLHVPYSSTQIAFATDYLRDHRGVRVVTIGIGANDLFLLQDSCATSSNPTECIEAGLPSVLASVGANMSQILLDLRSTGYGGEIVIVNYYSLDYSDAANTEITQLLNQTIAAPAKSFGAVVADVFSTFQKVVSNPAIAGKTCNAGLLNVNPQDPTQATCDVHPSQSGQRLIAETVARAVKDRPW